MINQTRNDFIPQKRCGQIRGCGDLCIYLKQNPKILLPSLLFIISFSIVLALGVAYTLKFHPNACFFVAGAAGIISNLYGLCHFRTLLNLKQEIDEYSSNNKQFAQQNQLLTNDVNRFSKSKDEFKLTSIRIREAVRTRKVELGKLCELNVNLKVTGKKSLSALGDINEMALTMKNKWKEQLANKYRKILYICFDRFKWENGTDGISIEQFIEFKLILPMEFQLKLTRAGDWKTIAGDDGILQLDEFILLLDNFTDEKRI